MNQPQGTDNGVFQPQTLDVDETIFNKNLKIVDGNELEDKMSEVFPGLTKNPNLPLGKEYKQERSLFPQQEYPTIQVNNFLIYW